MLAMIDLKFDIVPSNVEEAFNIGLPPTEFVTHYANI